MNEHSIKNPYMHTSSGAKYYPLQPNYKDVDINVIAHHLATKGRWNGATQHPEFPELIFLSVAEHSVYVAETIETELQRPDLALEALLHDGSEAFNGDLIRPLKYSSDFAKPFKQVEERNERAVARRFMLPYPMSPEIKTADDMVCHAEWLQVVPRDKSFARNGTLHDTSRAANIKIQMLNPHEAKQLFLAKYREIVSRTQVPLGRSA